MKLSDVRLIYDYNCWANKLLLSKASELTAEQLVQPTSSSWGNIQETLLHILDSEYVWRTLC